MFLTYFLSGVGYTSRVKLHQSCEQDPAALLILRWKEGTRHTMGLHVLRLGQLNLEASHSLVLQTCVGCTCGCGVCWSCGETLATERMMI